MTGQQIAVQLQLPGGLGAGQLRIQPCQGHPEALEAPDLERHTADKVAAHRALRRGIALERGLPDIPVQLTQVAADGQPRAAGQRRLPLAQQQLATPGRPGTRRRRQGQAGQIFIGQPVTPLLALQGHAPIDITRLCGGLAEGRRQIEGQALERRFDPQLAVRTVQGQGQAIRQLATGRQWLTDGQPVADTFQGHQARGLDARARLAALTFGDNFRPHGTTKYLRPHIRRTQAGGTVEAKGALDVIQLQSWLADLQACLLGGKIHLHYRCLPGSQGNIQFQPAAQGALALPTGEGLLDTQGRLAEDLQAIGHATLQFAVQSQAHGSTIFGRRNSDADIAHFAVQHLALGQLHPHALIIDKHLRSATAQRRPTGLIGQLGILHLKKQTKGTGRGRGVFRQGALILKIPLVDLAADNGCAQPLP